MIKKLQKKFIMITMISLLAVMIFLVGLTNTLYLYQTNRNIDGTISLLLMNQGKFPVYDKQSPPKPEHNFFEYRMDEETRFQTRYFVVDVKEDGSIRQTDTGHIKAVSAQDAWSYAAKVLENGKTSGFEGIYKYKIEKQDTGYLIIFMDCRSQLQNIYYLFVISCTVAVLTFGLMFLLVTIFSKKAMKPFIENYDKQKRFITDAGHEIKTPLAIISANADVLEMTGGENEWIASIRNQTVRLDRLVRNLLTLSKMDEENMESAFTEFNLSDLVAKTTDSFLSMAEAKNRVLRTAIPPGIKLVGDQGSIEQLISTLIDNAIKYSDEGGDIKVSLASAKKGVRLEFYNTVDHLEVANLNQLFERFYRADESRSRETGGYGIGLSIARSIAEAHQGKITVKSQNGKAIYFTVFLNTK